MLEIRYFYWLLAAFLLYSGWRNAREGRWAQAGFWSLLAVTFGGGDWILAAHEAGNDLPVQLSGLALVAIALLATRMKREHIAEAPVEERRASAQRLGHRLFLPAVLIPLVTVLVAMLGSHVSIAGIPLAWILVGAVLLVGLVATGAPPADDDALFAAPEPSDGR